MNDIFNEQSSTDIFNDFKENTNKGDFPSVAEKKVNYWDKTDVVPLNLDVSKFKKTGKSFTVYAFPENDLPEDAVKNILTLAKAMMGQGYVFRHTGNVDNVLQKAIIGLEGANYKSYLPWKKYNPDIKTPTLPTEFGYRTAITIHKRFMNMPPAVRAIISRDVNALLGTEVTDPVDVVIAWTDGGAEALTKNIDFKKIGNNTFMLQVARRANIPVVNVYNSGFIDRFKEIVKSH